MEILIKSHSGLRWIVLILLLMAIFNAVSKKGKGVFTASDKKLNLFALMSVHIQLVLGIILYFTSTKVVSGAIFANSVNRFYGMEHVAGMLIAIALITIGYSKSKRQEDANRKHRTVFLFYTIGLILIIASIPWPFRNLGGAWF